MYYDLSRACLALRSVFDSPELATVQAILLMASYHGMAGKRYTMDSSVGGSRSSAQCNTHIALVGTYFPWSKISPKRMSVFIPQALSNTCVFLSAWFAYVFAPLAIVYELSGTIG